MTKEALTAERENIHRLVVDAENQALRLKGQAEAAETDLTFKRGALAGLDRAIALMSEVAPMPAAAESATDPNL